jgi:hypothetical protein
MKQIHKEYERPFLLEKTKLDRLMDIIHDRLGEHQETTKRDDFEVFLSGHRREEMTSVDDVLKLDNSRKSKIQRLLMTCCASTEGAVRPEHEIQVDFDGRTTPWNKRTASWNKTKVTVSVRSDNAGWSDRALSEVEEQVERTSLQDFPARATLVLLTGLVSIVILLMLLFSLSSSRSAIDSAGAMWLRAPDLDHVEQILKQGRTITDEEMRQINTMQLHNLLEEQRQKPAFSGWSRQKTFVGGPLMIVLACAVYLGLRCYPSAVFLWGDEVERYNKMLQTRRIVWGLLIGGIFFGVLSKFLCTGLVSGP